MNELENAKQIAAEAFNFKSKASTTIEQQNETLEVNRKAFMQIISLPSLTIPKSIAKTLDLISPAAKAYCDKNGYDYTILDDSQELRELYEAESNEIRPEFEDAYEFCRNNLNLCVAYLVSKTMNADFVQIEDDLSN